MTEELGGITQCISHNPGELMSSFMIRKDDYGRRRVKAKHPLAQTLSENVSPYQRYSIKPHHVMPRRGLGLVVGAVHAGKWC